MDDIYKNIEEYNPNQKRKILFVFNYIIADMLRKNNLNPIVTELLTRSRELYSAINHSSDMDFKDFTNLYKKCTWKPYSSLVIDTTLAWDNPLCFRKNLLERI